MSRRTIEICTCDMCGETIDTSDEQVLIDSILCKCYSYVPVHFYNPSYDKGLQYGVTFEQLDLCPACADRYATIHMEVVPTEDGRSCRHEYSWRRES